jgi:hypothetical protein
MEWSTETPKRPGYYWARTKDEKGGEGELVLVQFDGSRAARPGDKTISSAMEFDEWLGPIAEPKKPLRVKEKVVLNFNGWKKEEWINKGTTEIVIQFPHSLPGMKSHSTTFCLSGEDLWSKLPLFVNKE